MLRPALVSLLAFAYLASFALHGLAHGANAQKETCLSCTTGQARAAIPKAPALQAPAPVSTELVARALPAPLPGLRLAPSARAPPR